MRPPICRYDPDAPISADYKIYMRYSGQGGRYHYPHPEEVAHPTAEMLLNF